MASWTLKCELTSGWVARLIKYMDDNGKKQVVAYLPPDHGMAKKPLFDFSSGYLLRARNVLPCLGDQGPWKSYNYPNDLIDFNFGSLDDGVLKFEE